LDLDLDLLLGESDSFSRIGGDGDLETGLLFLI
jgi:hypothetical protein